MLVDISTGAFPAKPEPEKCGVCEFRKICAHRALESP
jgi:hypothetical protein